MNSKIYIALIVISLLLVGCGGNAPTQPLETPTVIPPTATATPKPITAEDLSSAVINSKDLPEGFEALNGSDLQDMQELVKIVTADFPDAKIVGLTAYAKTLDDGQYEAVVISFYFLPLSDQDIALFDNSELAHQTFSHGASYTQQIMDENYIGDYSVNLSMSMGGFVIDEIVGRRESVGFTAMVLHGQQPFEKMGLATTTAQVLNNKIQEIMRQ